MGRLRWRWLIFGEFVEALSSSKGWRKMRLVLVTSLVAISLHVVAVQIHELASGIIDLPAWERLGAFLSCFVIFLRWLQVEIRGLLASTLHVNQNPRPSCKALIFFLSPSSGLEKRWQKDLEGLDAHAVVEAFSGTPWQQPLRAIRAHLQVDSRNQLDYIYVVDSADHPDYQTETDPKRKDRLKGTVHYFDDFRETAMALAARCLTTVEVYHAGSLGTRWQNGVDFENASDLLAALSAVFHDLRSKKVRDPDILVDITGSSSLCSAVGAAIALDDTRRFQYVSQHSGEVFPYDLDYVIGPVPGE